MRKGNILVPLHFKVLDLFLFSSLVDLPQPALTSKQLIGGQYH